MPSNLHEQYRASLVTILSTPLTQTIASMYEHLVMLFVFHADSFLDPAVEVAHKSIDVGYANLRGVEESKYS